MKVIIWGCGVFDMLLIVVNSPSAAEQIKV